MPLFLQYAFIFTDFVFLISNNKGISTVTTVVAVWHLIDAACIFLANETNVIEISAIDQNFIKPPSQY